MPAILYAFSDPLRLKIVAELASADEAISASDFSVGKSIAKSTLSHHFKVLRESGVTHALQTRPVHEGTVDKNDRYFRRMRYSSHYDSPLY